MIQNNTVSKICKRKEGKKGGQRGEKNSNLNSKKNAVIIFPLSEMKCFKVMFVDSLDTELESLLTIHISVKSTPRQLLVTSILRDSPQPSSISSESHLHSVLHPHFCWTKLLNLKSIYLFSSLLINLHNVSLVLLQEESLYQARTSPNIGPCVCLR